MESSEKPKRIQQERVLKYVVSLSRKHFEEIGFIPQTTLERYVKRGQLWIAQENNEPCGFLVYGNGWPILRIYQACVQYDAQRREHGLNLVRRLIGYADARGYESISLYCADDLESNKFWKEAGFKFAGQRDNGNSRGRKHNRWIFRLSFPLQSVIPFACIEQASGYRCG
jgi:ribosomal protein S18 acetylase RimI-like enzyme